MNQYGNLKQRLESEINKYVEECFELNKDLDANPELSGLEYRSSQKIVELLRRHGFEVEYPFYGSETAFFGKFGNQGHKYKIAIMTEYDALPEIGHACGHCLSGSISVLSAIALASMQDDLDADIHIVGTPKEEHGGLKCPLADGGFFDDYDMAIMVHLYDKNMVATKLLAIETFDLKYYGKASHAANAPWEGRNALNGAQLFFHAMDMLRQHVKPDVRMHAVITNGGKRPNIVPEEAAIEIYVRSLSRDYLKEVVKKVEDCAKGAAIATQTTYERIDDDGHCYDDLLEIQSGMDALNEVFDEINLKVTPHQDIIFGSSDAGNVSYCCPTFHPTVQVVPEGTSIHTRDFEAAMCTPAAHKALLDGAQLISYMVAKVLDDPCRIEQIKEEFKRKTS